MYEIGHMLPQSRNPFGILMLGQYTSQEIRTSNIAKLYYELWLPQSFCSNLKTNVTA